MNERFTTAESGNLKLIELPTKEVHRDDKAKTRALTIGVPTDKETLTVLLLGETGSGKTHLLNALANVFLGVKHSDDFRFVLKDQVDGHRRQVESQTDYITSYLIYHKEGMPINYNFRIIDTPGFGDTRPDYERRVTQHLFSFFLEDFATDSLHCIGLVEKANNNRISRSRLDILKAFSSLFSRDAGPFTKLLATFASDGNQVEVVVRAASISISGVYEFDNWPLYTIPRSNAPHDIQNHKYRWDNMKEELTRFLKDISQVTPLNVKQVRWLREERRLLAETKTSLKKQVKQAASDTQECDNLKRKMEKERQEAEVINWNPLEKHWTKVQSEVAAGSHVHNCNICDKTCLSCEDPSNTLAAVVGSTSGVAASGVAGIGSTLVAGLVTGAEVGMFGGPIGVAAGASVGIVVGLTVGLTSGLLSRKEMSDCPKASSSEPCNVCKHEMSEHTVGLTQIKEVETIKRKLNPLLKSKYDQQMRKVAKTEGLIKAAEEKIYEHSKILLNLVSKVRNHIKELSVESDALTEDKFVEEMTREIQDEEQIRILKLCFQEKYK